MSDRTMALERFKRFTCRCLLPPRLRLTLAFVVCCLVIHVIVDSLYLIYVHEDDDVTTPGRLAVDARCHINAPSDVVPSAQRSSRLERDLVDGMSHCPSLRRPLSDTERTEVGWHYQNAVNSSIIVYSAIYDERTTDDVVTPSVRLLGLASLEESKNKVFCQVWFEEYQRPYFIEAVSNVIGRRRGYTLNGRQYVQYLLSCRLPGIDPVPTHVSLVATDQCANSTMYVPIERPVRSEPDHEFGVCVAISFGSIPVTEFVEWIELHRMFGVTEFNIYDAGMENMSAVFDYYVKQGLLRVHPMPPPVPVRWPVSFSRSTSPSELNQLSATKLDSIKVSSSASLNDCLLRNVYRYRYVIVIDFDEVIVPRIHGNYSQMMRDIIRRYPQTSSITSYSFKNVYFFLNFHQDETQPSYLRTARFRLRAATSPFKMAPKSFINPRSCLTLFNHYCHIPLTLPSRNLTSTLFDVNPKLAASHHYRKCDFSEAKCASLFKQQTRDDIALHFKDNLQRLVHVAMKTIEYDNLSDPL